MIRRLRRFGGSDGDGDGVGVRVGPMLIRDRAREALGMLLVPNESGEIVRAVEYFNTVSPLTALISYTLPHFRLHDPEKRKRRSTPFCLKIETRIQVVVVRLRG